jgi:hypothetical protein
VASVGTMAACAVMGAPKAKVDTTRMEAVKRLKSGMARLIDGSQAV